MNRMKFEKKLLSVLTVLMCLIAVAGCNDPETIGRFQATPVTNIILDNLGLVDEEPQPFSNARLPRPEDLLVPESEYVIRSGDILNISIMDLFQTNQEWVAQKQVSESGRITLPEIGSVMAAGYTELELQKSIERALSPSYIKDPKVSAVVAASTGKVYTVTGAVPAPAPYQLTEPDLRILKALAHAGGVPPRGVDYIYIIRKVSTSDLLEDGTTPAVSSTSDFVMPDEVFSPVEVSTSDPEVQEQPVNEAQGQEEQPAEKTVEQQLMESISPLSAAATPQWAGKTIIADSAADSADDGFEVVMGENGFEVEGNDSQSDTSGLTSDSSDNSDGAILGYKPLQYRQEVIKINLRELRNGDLSQNIVIQPGDYIYVPYNSTGVYYVMGQVSRPGPYQLTGEKMTLKQAIASVGGLSPLASPDRCDITRITSDNSEITYRVNLLKLFEGVQPDIYIKPNDMINVGSHPTARWVAVIRQSFRTTYGFGFVYDRNMADVDFYH